MGLTISAHSTAHRTPSSGLQIRPSRWLQRVSVSRESKDDENSTIVEDLIEENEDNGVELDPVQQEQLELQRILDDFLSPLALDLYELARRFSKVYSNLTLHSEEQYLPTPVIKLPTGLGTGRYLAVDIGGSNLRVAFIELLSDADESNVLPANASERSRGSI